eukprot:TRINITY_DN64686_c0_g1_i1.p1 TRINITY_DN64686_c0_g1~~TRINITY_DN64686_c0_g1_i1.p1  ORF type:complete len:278 (-),score=17.79 TRINITY_DN64686_c0_g1_i1:145-978(-)
MATNSFLREASLIYLEHEQRLHLIAIGLIVAVGCAVIMVEFGLNARAPYGRHASLPAARWYGPKINPKAAWCFQESWSVTVPILLLCVDADVRCLTSWGNRVLLAMFLSHYSYRTLIYPLRLRGGASMPVGLCFLASAFCAFNGFVQGRAWVSLYVRPMDTAISVCALVGGIMLWALGFAVNFHSDSILRALRQPGETGYKVPRGGAFEYVSAANYAGEILEWCGYALASGLSPPAVAFAFFTFANLGPRAYHHHQWYRAKFDDYPAHRRALIPFLW